MATLVYINGFDHSATISTNGGSLYSVINGTWTTDGTTVRTGSYSVKSAVSANAASNLRAGYSVGGTTIVQRFYVRWNTLPTGTTIVDIAGCAVSPSTSFPCVSYNPSTGYFAARFGTAGKVEDTVTVQANTWYCIDFKSTISGTTMYLDVKVDGRALSQTSVTTTATSFTNPYLGTARTDGTAYDVYFDDWIVSVTSGDYPLGAGGVQLLAPNSDGSHNNGSLYIQDQGGIAIGTAYNKVAAVPPSTTFYIKMTGNDTDDYVEINFANISHTHNAVLGASVLLVYTSSATQSNTAGCIASKDTFNTSTTVLGAPGALADYSNGSTSNLYYKMAIIDGVNNDSTIDALQVRLGYAGDSSPNPYWVEIYAQVAYSVSTNITRTVNQVSETDTAQAITKIKVKAVSQVSETDTANAITKAKQKTVNQVSETDTAQTISKIKRKAVNQVSETDTAFTIIEYVPSQIVNVNQVSETDSAQLFTKRKIKLLNQTLETDTSGLLTKVKRKTVGQVFETDTSQTVSEIKRKAVGQVTETNTAQAISKIKRKAVGQVSETDTAQTISEIKRKTVNQVFETDTAQAITKVKRKTIGQVLETDTAQSISKRKIVRLNQIIESDTAQQITLVGMTIVQQVAETDIAQALFKTKRVYVTGPTETDSAQHITIARIYVVSTAIETDYSGVITQELPTVIPVNQAVESDIAQSITVTTHLDTTDLHLNNRDTDLSVNYRAITLTVNESMLDLTLPE